LKVNTDRGDLGAFPGWRPMERLKCLCQFLNKSQIEIWVTRPAIKELSYVQNV